ncbi:MAG: rhodanese-related sulfurtransferase [Patescibacteria group bacterium]
MQVLLYYKYVAIKEPEWLAELVHQKCEKLSLLGRIIVAAEGINGTVEGTVESTESFATWLVSLSEFSDMKIKRSESDGAAFTRLSVRVRDEIVGTHFGDAVDPTKQTGKHIKPEELHEALIRGDDITIIDMRNSYEFKSGHFKNAVDPGMQNSRDLPNVLPKLAHLKDKKVLTVCTGGIRCEKMSAYLLANGFTDVSQLEGGIHTYMELYPGQDFEGTLYTFDRRHTMDFGGDRSVVGRCDHCDTPTERYVNCMSHACKYHFLSCTACTTDDRTSSCRACMISTGLIKPHVV